MKSVVLCCDCKQDMKKWLSISKQPTDLAHCDPPYFSGPERRKYYGNRMSPIGVRRLYKPIKSWIPPDAEYFDLLKATTKNQIIWGANYYPDLVGETFKSPTHDRFQEFLEQYPTGWILWDKVNYSSIFSDCELAWTSFDKPSVIFRYMWNGMFQGKSISEGHIQQGDKRKNEVRIHPTQKPVPLYKWVLMEYAEPGWTVYDSHVGSGSSRIACYDLGLEFGGCEIEFHYWQLQEERFRNYVSQLLPGLECAGWMRKGA